MDVLLGSAQSGAGNKSDAIYLRHPGNREFLGGDLLAQCMHALGVRVMFGLHGGHLDAFLIGADDMGIRLIDTRHETVAVQAAEGYAKVSGRVGVSFVTANSGFSNALPGLASALADRSPVFVVTSSPPLRDAETNTLQGFHQQDVIAKPLTKFAHRVTTVEEIPRLVAHAWRTAISGAPGPVLLDFPIDILFSPPDPFRISWGAITRPMLAKPSAPQNAIDMALTFIRKSKRPCIISGTGAKGYEASQHLIKFADMTGIPVFNSTKYGGLMPIGHPLRAGPASVLASLSEGNEEKGKESEQPDLILLLGVRTGFLLGSRGGSILPKKGCHFVQVDTDGAEIGRSHSIDLGIVADAGFAMKQLVDTLEPEEAVDIDIEWIKKATALKNIKSPHDDEPLEMSPGRAHPHHAVKAVFEALNSGAIVIMDGGESSCWAQDLVEKYSGASAYLIATGYLGFLGSGWGYALGAALADPTRQVVNVQGDGSAGFHIAELETYVKHELNILTVIVNNACWGMSQSGQELIFGDATDSRPAAKLSSKTKYEMVAEGFGCPGGKVDKVEDIDAAVKKLSDNRLADNKRGPGCLNLIVSEKPIHPSTTAMVGKTDDENVIVVPYYDNLPRPRYDHPEVPATESKVE